MTKNRILIVDDEKNVREHLKYFLKLNGYIVETSSSSCDAIFYIQNNKPDYAIIDLKLNTESDYGGIELFRYVKKSDPNIKILILSAYPFKEDVEEVFRKIQDKEGTVSFLKEVENNYICKVGEQNYILSVLEKLNNY